MISRAAIVALALISASVQAKDSLAITIQEAYLQFLPRGMVAPTCESHVLAGDKFISCQPSAGLWLIRDETIYAANGKALGYLGRLQEISFDFAELPPNLKTASPGEIFAAIDSGRYSGPSFVTVLPDSKASKADIDKYCKYKTDYVNLIRQADQAFGVSGYGPKRDKWMEPKSEKLRNKYYGSYDNYMTESRKVDDVNCPS